MSAIVCSKGDVKMKDDMTILRQSIRKAKELGLDVDTRGSITVNESTFFRTLSRELSKKDIIYENIKEGLKEYPYLLEKYGLKKIKLDVNEISNGILLYVPKNETIDEPIYTCFSLAKKGVVQKVYNLIILDSEAEAISVTGCFSLAYEGIHSSLTEIYLSRQSKLYNIMLHNWLPKINVSALKVITLNEQSLYYDVYLLNYSQLEKISFVTEIHHEGRNSSSRVDSIILPAREGTYRYKTTSLLKAEGSTSEVHSRIVAGDKVNVYNYAEMRALAPKTKGHIDCRGLITSDEAELSTMPILLASTKDSELTHEASIGKLKQEELEYLYSKGFNEEEAISLLIRGFIDTGINYLPEKLQVQLSLVFDRLSQMKF